MDEYAIRCFIGEDRKMTDELTAKEAKIFRHTALHLVKYLTKEYDLPPLSAEQMVGLDC